MKPWEETWSGPEPDMTAIVVDDGTKHGHPFWQVSYGFEDGDIERAKLAAAAPEMARLLLSLEKKTTYEETVCATCGGHSAHNGAKHPKPLVWHIMHEPDCEWVAVLRKAGVL